MPDTSITHLDPYQPTGGASAHPNDVFVIVDVYDQSMSSSGTDKKLTISQFTTPSGGTPCILDVALHPVAQGDLIYRGSAGWVALAPGTSGYILSTQGASANPQWVANSVANITGAAPLASPTFTGTVTLSTATNLVLTDQASAPFIITTGTTYGTKLGGTTSQKLGFYNADPVVQPSGDLLTSLTNLGLIASPTITHWTGGITSISGTTSVAINCANTNAFHVALQTTGEHTFTVSNLKIGQTIKITTIQGASPANSTITWAGQTIRWAGGTAGQATATATKGDMFVLYGVSGASPPAADVIGGTIALANF